MFSLTNPAGAEPTKYTVQDPTEPAVLNSTVDNCFGPWFTDGNGIGICCNVDVPEASWSLFPGNYVDTTGRGHATFTGDRVFTMDKLEVWSVLPKGSE